MEREFWNGNFGTGILRGICCTGIMEMCYTEKNQNLMRSVRGGKKQYGGRSKET